MTNDIDVIHAQHSIRTSPAPNVASTADSGHSVLPTLFVQSLVDVPRRHKQTPPLFDENAPVIFLELDYDTAGLMLSVSKVKIGKRFATTHLSGTSVVIHLPEGQGGL